jgi:hypothetical protein
MSLIAASGSKCTWDDPRVFCYRSDVPAMMIEKHRATRL